MSRLNSMQQAVNCQFTDIESNYKGIIVWCTPGGGGGGGGGGA